MAGSCLFFVAGAQTHRYWPRGVALSPHSGPKRFADGRRHAYCSGTDKKRISNSGRLPGSSREPSPEALELSLVAPRTPGACPWGPWAPGGDSSRASGEGSREDPGSRPELEIRFLSVPEQYQVKCKQMWHKTRACLAGSPSVRRSLGTFPTLPLGFSLWALTRPIFTDFYRVLPIFQTFLGDFNHQKLPLTRL
mgnify:CR=1 FL=1